MGTLANTLTPAHPDLAERMVATIRAELDVASTPEATQAALAGLGNAAREHDTETVLAYRTHGDKGVRAQVASSLRFSSDPRATDALFELLADRERFVAASALDVIEFYRPDDDALRRLALTVVNGVVQPELEGPLVSVLAKRGLDDDLAREAMAVLRERSTDARTRLRIRRILGLEA
jgi:HEAT repeat protein